MITDEGKSNERNTGIKACRHFPSFVKPGRSPRSRVIFAVEGFISYRWKKQQGEEGSFPFAPLEETLATQDVAQNKRRTRIQVLVGAHHDTERSRTPIQGEPRAGIWQGRWKKLKGKGRKGIVPIFSDRIDQLSALTHRLLKRWQSRRQSVSEPPRGKRESGLTDKSKSSGPTRQGTFDNSV